MITVSIGKPIDPTGMEANELNLQVENWIETEVARISHRKPTVEETVTDNNTTSNT